MVHPLSQAEADRVFSQQDRAEKSRIDSRQINNLKQRAYREDRKGREALSAWFSKTGSPLDLIDYERSAEKLQTIIGQMPASEGVK